MAPGRLVVAAAKSKKIQVHLFGFVSGFYDHRAQSLTRPPSTTRFWPVTARDQGEAKNSAASASSAGVVTRRSGVLPAIRSNTTAGVADDASVVCNSPPEIMLTVMPRSEEHTSETPVTWP